MALSTALAYVSGTALVIAVLSMIGVHLGKTGFNPVRDAISLYVYAPRGYLYRADAVARGVCALVLLARCWLGA
jgi:hypothetical protein